MDRKAGEDFVGPNFVERDFVEQDFAGWYYVDLGIVLDVEG